MPRRTTFVAVALLVAAATLPAVEARLPRHPAPSPDGSQILFPWQGDLWLVAAEGGGDVPLESFGDDPRTGAW